jgi:hypothetical protein
MRGWALLAVMACGSLPAFAQHGGMGGGRGMGMPGGHGGGMPHERDVPRGGAGPMGGGGGNHGGLRLGPPGRWWDDKRYSSSLGINGDQKRRMDSVFEQHRDELVTKYKNLQKAQSSLEKMTKSDHPDQGALFGEIDHVAAARADLEKANTSMLLGIRGEMTPEQIDKLEDLQ